jgi:hypothetical protein
LRRQIIEVKQIRRVPLGDNISVVFENFQTMLWQTQEMLRAERITEPELIQEEIDTYNELVPDDNELRATLFIELPDSQNIPQDLPRFIGVEEAVSLSALTPFGRRRKPAAARRKRRLPSTTSAFRSRPSRRPRSARDLHAWLWTTPITQRSPSLGRRRFCPLRRTWPASCRSSEQFPG